MVQSVNYLLTLVPDDRARLKRNILTYNLDDVMPMRHHPAPYEDMQYIKAAGLLPCYLRYPGFKI